MHASDGGENLVRCPALRIPHPERVLYPKTGITRGEGVSYYAEVAPYLLQQAEGRALTVKRWPHGIQGPMFYQKHPSPGVPLTVSRVEELLFWVGQGALEWHAPLGFLDNPGQHTWVVLDLDPNPPAGWNDVLTAGFAFKQLLELMGVGYLMKTSGQRGLHFYVRVLPVDWRVAMAIIKQWAALIAKTIPDVATVERLKRDRGPRVYLDYLQNGRGRTTVMAYSLRATPGASVSSPITWPQAAHPPGYWTMERTRNQLKKHGNLFCWKGPPVDLVKVAIRHGFRKEGG